MGSFSFDVVVFLAQQPADVGEEEAVDGVVGVGVRLAVFVVHPVVAGPVNYCVLNGRKL